jgi:manganese/zinc/iron transport system permease protein
MNLLDLFTDYTLRNIALGSAILGVVGGVLGSYALLRRQSLLGDALSHAALPGIVIAFLVTGTREQGWLLAGAGVTAWLAAMLLLALLRYSRLKTDGALALALSVFFGIGLTLLSYTQNSPRAAQAGLDRFIFGQAASIIERDVWLMSGLAVAALAMVWLLAKEFKLLTFDPDYLAALGFRAGWLGTLLTSLIVVAVMIGLQTVGVVLMSAMLVTPAAAARQWTNRLEKMLVLAAAFGAASGIAGAVISATAPRTPTGPVVILCATAIMAGSLFFAPLRGLAWAAVGLRRNRRRFARDRVLLQSHLLETRSGTGQLTTSSREVAGHLHIAERSADQAFAALAADGLVDRERGEWRLTDSGRAAARSLEAELTEVEAGSGPGEEPR